MITIKAGKKNIITLFSIIMASFFLIVILIFYGPISYFRELYITTAMTTMSHQYLARMLYSDDYIEKVLDKNRIKNVIPASRVEDIKITSDLSVSESVYNYDTLDVPLKELASIYKFRKTELEKVELFNIKGPTYTGYLLKINDPSRVFLGSTNKLNNIGVKLKDMIKSFNALAGINAGGFDDPNGEGFGGVPTECIIENSKVIYGDMNKSYDIIGFNNKNVLVLSTMTLSQALQSGIRDAIAFSPYLVVNGEGIITEGNGGWGLGPRTAIGQTKDGKVLLLAIDGRQLHSIGATLLDVQNIMLEYGAYNAANLDGGSSTVMYYNGNLINKPCSPYGERFLPSAFLVKKLDS